MTDIVKIRLTYKALQDMNFPFYSGSTLRGIFGKSLKRYSCLAQKENCVGCAMQKDCPYCTVFENGFVNAGEDNPNPYVIEPMPIGQKSIKQGEYFSIHQIIFGDAVKKISYILLAWVKTGNMGFTKERTQARLVKIEQISADNSVTLLHNFENPDTEEEQSINPDFQIPPAEKASKIKIELETPLRIHHQGHPIIPAKLTAQDFLMSLIRRQENMAKYHIKDYPNINFALLREDIANMQMSEADLHWMDWKRYSSRQKTGIALGGIMGNFILTGNFANLYPYLKMGEYFHLGKSTVMGLGKYKIKIVE